MVKALGVETEVKVKMEELTMKCKDLLRKEICIALKEQFNVSGIEQVP